LLQKNKRQRLILELLQSDLRVTITEIANRFNVSEITIRRDFKEFKEQGIMEKGLGGTILVTDRNDLPINQRMKEERECKECIARTAAQLIGDSTSIFVGSGTTTAHLIPYLVNRNNFTVVTNALNLSSALAYGKGLTVVVVGGLLRASELSLVGHIAEQALSEIRVDKVFIGMAAIGVETGLTNDYLPEVMTDRKIFELNSETILLADHTKFGKTASAFVAPIEKISILITDDKTDPEILEKIKRLGVKVIIAESSDDTTGFASMEVD